jgi:hypothetical protein
VERAVLISPMDPLGYYFDGFRAAASLASEDYAAAAGWALRSIRGNRAHVPSYITHAIASALEGNVSAARESAAMLTQLMPRFSSARYGERFPNGDLQHFRRYREALLLAGAPP